jgi:hypothetical protein
MRPLLQHRKGIRLCLSDYSMWRILTSHVDSLHQEHSSCAEAGSHYYAADQTGPRLQVQHNSAPRLLPML